MVLKDIASVWFLCCILLTNPVRGVFKNVTYDLTSKFTLYNLVPFEYWHGIPTLNGSYIAYDTLDVYIGQVMCRMLNKPSTKVMVKSMIWGTNVHIASGSCVGTESSLVDCANITITTIPTTLMVARLYCLDAVEGSFRLTKSDGKLSTNYGELQILHNQQWGTICSNHFTAADMRVACKTMGFSYPSNNTIIPNTYHYNRTNVKVWLNKVGCRGIETDVSQCPHSPWGAATCRHDDTIAILCGGVIIYKLTRARKDETDGVKSILSKVALEQLNGEGTRLTPGSVCENGLGDREAKILCEQSGYPTGISVALPGATSYPSYEPPEMDSVTCKTGREKSLSECENSGWGDANCTKRETATVLCATADKPPLLLYEPGKNETFTVQLYGINGSLCTENIDENAAKVICGSKHYPPDETVLNKTKTYPGDNGLFWFADLKCKGDEKKLTDCQYSALVDRKCPSKSTPYIKCNVGDRGSSDTLFIALGVAAGSVLSISLTFFLIRRRIKKRITRIKRYKTLQ